MCVFAVAVLCDLLLEPLILRTDWCVSPLFSVICVKMRMLLLAPLGTALVLWRLFLLPVPKCP
jgi:hypothetical protein